MKFLKTILFIAFSVLLLIGSFLYISPIHNKIGRWIALSSIFNSHSNKNDKNEKEHAIFPISQLNRLKDGDIILRRGFGSFSNWIAKGLDETYSVTHCGVLEKKDSLWMVINSESNQFAEGMQLTDFRKFIINSQPNSLIIVRLKEKENERATFLHWMNHYLERKEPFDYKFDDTDTTRLYCTEVIALSLQKTFKKDLLTLRSKIGFMEGPSFANFLNPAHFEIILNQFEEKLSLR